jgi:rod shape determining protein RodA
MRRNGLLLNLDWFTIVLYLLLVAIGVAFIFSTTYSPLNENIFDVNYPAGRQIVWFFVSLFVGGVILIVDAKFYNSFAYIIFGAILLLLASVLFFGVTINGSKSWFALGPIRFQPAELAKFATALALAKYLTNLNVNLEKFNSKIYTLIIVGLPTFFILLQGDVGSALVFAGFIFVLHREGLESGWLVLGFGGILFSVFALLFSPFVLLITYASILIVFVFYDKKKKYPFIGTFLIITGFIFSIILYNKFLLQYFEINEIEPYLMLLAICLTVLFTGAVVFYKSKNWILPAMAIYIFIGLYTFSVNFLFNNVFKQHHRDRIDLILGKIEDRSGVGYNLFQSKIAIGSGGVAGKGYLNGTQTMLNFVPEQSTDFIFTSIAEETGFIGSFFLIAVFTLLLLRILFIAERQRSRFVRVYAYGVACVLFVHYAINISMTIGLAPVIGIPLPYVSYGGSSLLAFTILLFVLLKLDAERLNVFR